MCGQTALGVCDVFLDEANIWGVHGGQSSPTVRGLTQGAGGDRREDGAPPVAGSCPSPGLAQGFVLFPASGLDLKAGPGASLLRLRSSVLRASPYCGSLRADPVGSPSPGSPD